jgi:menaquinone-9 beta-reductase
MYNTNTPASTPTVDMAIIGGGLAGLCLSIQAARAGYSVVLFEKETYPFHRVCGEYISLESWNFLEELGIPLSDLNLPIIRKVVVTSPGGQRLERELSLGGFGISRFKLDQLLADLAEKNGVKLHTGTKVTDVHFGQEEFEISCESAGNVPGHWSARVVAGAFGKRSNLDVKWKRDFVSHKPGKLNNYIGVKYHVRYNTPADTIALHNFQNGYCGISRIEDGKSCLCYLATANELSLAGNSIGKLEQTFLSRNPYLRDILENAERLYDEPVVISQISFEKKNLLENHVLMIGDAAGMITPLCGNGMSMAMHGSKIASRLMQRFLQGELSREQMESQYESEWRAAFHRRLSTGRFVQSLFGKDFLTNFVVRALKPLPAITDYLIRQTHGEPF